MTAAEMIAANAEGFSKGHGKPRVFVYGSLKKGQGNDVFLQTDGAEYLGRAALEVPAKFINFGGFPGVVRKFQIDNDIDKASPSLWKDRPTRTIVGEVYAVDEATFTGLDFLEGYPSFYQRHKYKLTHTGSKDADGTSAWMYTLPDTEEYNRMQEVKTPHWNALEAEKAYWDAYMEVVNGG